jgi:hypothetical protein
VSDTKPTLASVLNRAIAGALDDVRVALPGRVVRYDAAKQRVDVQPLVKDGYENESGARVAERLPVVSDVPVIFPGSGLFRITFPVKEGDTVLLVFASSSLARWKATGSEVDPGDDRHHTLADAIAIPGLLAKPGTAAPTDAIEIHSTSEIRCGGTQPLVTREEFLKHTHATAGTGTPSPPIVGAVPGSALTFPGTTKLRG